METYFAPAKRTDPKTFEDQIKAVSHSVVMSTLLTTMAGLLLVLNQDRQVVALNSEFLKHIGIDDPEKVLGLRLGQILSCEHADELPNGCGTTPDCVSCGAAISIMAAIDDDRETQRVCALSAEKDQVKNDVCLLVRAKPIVVEKRRWILLFAQDVTKQHFWVNLERVFFHDISNIMSILVGNVELALDDHPDDEIIKELEQAALRLSAEVSLQKSLAREKDATYLSNKSKIPLKNIRDELRLVVSGHGQGKNKQVIEDWQNEDKTVLTDSILVIKILSNMVINALEATPEGGTIRIRSRFENNDVIFEVANDQAIPQDLSNRIFQRHFSTKSGPGWGLGTYSMKLFGERYLKGRVSFTSSEETGTVFSLAIPC